MVVDVVLEAVGGVAAGAALVAGAPLAEVIPGEDSVLVAVVPIEADGVIAHRGNLAWDGAAACTSAAGRRLRAQAGWLGLAVTLRRSSLHSAQGQASRR